MILKNLTTDIQVYRNNVVLIAYIYFTDIISNYCMKKRIEIHLTSEETAKLDKIAESEGRSRKNYCENEIRKLIVKHEKP